MCIGGAVLGASSIFFLIPSDSTVSAIPCSISHTPLRRFSVFLLLILLPLSLSLLFTDAGVVSDDNRAIVHHASQNEAIFF